MYGLYRDNGKENGNYIFIGNLQTQTSKAKLELFFAPGNRRPEGCSNSTCCADGRVVAGEDIVTYSFASITYVSSYSRATW